MEMPEKRKPLRLDGRVERPRRAPQAKQKSWSEGRGSAQTRQVRSVGVAMNVLLTNGWAEVAQCKGRAKKGDEYER